MKHYLSCLLFVVLSHSAWGQTEISARLTDFSHLQANFAQDRYLSGRGTPLRASGELLLSPDDGVWWRQEAPFGMTLVLTEQAMTQQIDGEAPQSLSASDERMQQFQQILQALLLVDLEALENNFDISAQPNEANERWTLLLIPNASPLDRLFMSFELRGDQVVRELLIQDADGGRTELRFSEHQLSNAALGEEERARFNQ